MRRPIVRSGLLALFVVFLTIADALAQGEFVYTNNNPAGPNSVSAFSVGADGVLTQIPGSPFLTGGMGAGTGVFAANRIRIAGNFLFASNSVSEDISVFSIDPATGRLSPVAGSPFPSMVSGFNGISLALSSEGGLLFAAGADTTTVKVFRVGLNGALSPLSAPPVQTIGGTLLSLNVSPDTKFLAVCQNSRVGHDELVMFSIGVDGSLTPVPGSPFRGGAFGPTTAVFNAVGDLLFGGERPQPTTTLVFRVKANGKVARIPGSPFVQGSGSEGANGEIALLSPDEKFLFVSNVDSHSVTVWNVAVDGSLSLVPGSAFEAIGDVTGLGQAAGLATNKDGSLLFVATNSVPSGAAVSVFKVSGSGALTLVPGAPFTTGQAQPLYAIAAYPATHPTPVVSFDLCIQDDGNGSLLQIGTATGDYQFSNCAGVTVFGRGQVTRNGNVIKLRDSSADRSVVAKIKANHKATATVQLLSSGMITSLADRNITDNTCTCK